MKLVNYHRIELVEQLKAAYQEFQQIQNELGEVSGLDNEATLEVRHVLAKARIDLIQKILVEGEMDY